MSRVGAHVSAAGGLDNAPDNAKKLGCEVFQFFSRSPRGGDAPELNAELIESFKKKCAAGDFESYVHTPYYINFASSNNRISLGSVNVVREELERGSKLDVKYVVTHLGSAKDLGKQEALEQTSSRIKSIYEEEEDWSAKLLLEVTAGAGGLIGDTFEELAFILKEIEREDVGICLDTCHLFASGYDLRTVSAIKKTLDEFEKNMPLEKFKLLHTNDSKVSLGSHRDRHADIGDGELGKETFKNLLTDPVFKERNFVLETPGGSERQKKDIKLLKKLRDA